MLCTALETGSLIKYLLHTFFLPVTSYLLGEHKTCSGFVSCTNCFSLAIVESYINLCGIVLDFLAVALITYPGIFFYFVLPLRTGKIILFQKVTLLKINICFTITSTL